MSTAERTTLTRQRYAGFGRLALLGRDRRDDVAGLARAALRRAGGPTAIVAVALWLCRRLVFSTALPAGTDMLDVLARARENASWTALLSPWSPSGLGGIRQTSLDNLLGLAVLMTGSPTRTVTMMLVLLVLLAGLTTYWVLCRWWQSRLGAALAAVLYMTSQAELGRVASGWLHYSLLTALTPLVLYVWVSLLDAFSPARALSFALLVSALMFARQDMVLWLVPALALYVPVRLLTAGRGSRPFRQLVMTTGVVVPVVLALSLYLVVPLTGGIHAPWLSTGQVFEQIRFNLLDRSLTAYQSMLGLGRDLGYLPFNGQEWWNFHPWFQLPVYYALQGLLVFAAVAVLAFRRDRLAIYLLVCACGAAFLGKGIRGPVGAPYWWGVEHVPVFGDLRGPNRWLIVQAFVYAALAGSTLAFLHRRWTYRLSRAGGRTSALAHPLLVLACCVLLLPVGPTLISGFRTWRPPASSVTLMRRIAADPSRAPVVSVPYDQSMAYVSTTGYQGWEHDLGVESGLYTDHPALSTNSWSRRGSDFVDFTASLLTSRDSAFTALLSSVGVKYALAFDYPAESEKAAATPPRLRQRRAIASLAGTVPVESTRTGALYRLTGAAPLLSLRTNVAVILGGRGGLADLARFPGVRMSDWAAFTADDLLTADGGSLPRLLTAMHESDVVLMADASTRDLAVLASRPRARVSGITSDPGLDRKYGLLLTDESARSGSLADQSVAPPALVNSSSQTFDLRHPARLELWSRVLTSPDAGTLAFSVDGRRVRSLVPLDAGRGAFRWIHVETLVLPAGSHTVSVSGGPSSYGRTFEVDESRLIMPVQRVANLRRLDRELRADASKVAYAIDLSAGPYANGGATTLGTKGRSFWRPQDSRGVTARAETADGNSALRLRFTGPRPFYTVAQHTFSRPQSWATRKYVRLRYRGNGSGKVYSFIFDFDSSRTEFASARFTDTSPGWRSFSFELRPGAGAWGHVTSVRIATQSKTGRGSIVLGPVSLLFPSRLVKRVELPTRPQTAAHVVSAGPGSGRGVAVEIEGDSVSASIPASETGDGAHVVIPPLVPLPDRRAIPVAVHQTGPARYSYTVASRHRGVLVFGQSYDPHWRATDAGALLKPTAPVTSLVDGFAVSPGAHEGSVYFRSGGLVRLGALLSMLAFVAVLLALGFLAWRGRGRAAATSGSRDERAALPRLTGPDLTRAVLVSGAVVALAPASFALCAGILVASCVARRTGWRPAVVAAVLFAAATGFVAAGMSGTADRLAVAATLALLIVLVRLARAAGRLARA